MTRKPIIPTVRSRRLAAVLREKRLSAGLTPAEAGDLADLSKMWIYRAEKPDCRPEPNNVYRILQVYGVTDPAEVAAIVALAKEAARPGWWNGYALRPDHAEFIAAEAEASEKYVWEPSLIPGLLQMAAYARVVIAAGPEHLVPGRVEELVRVRMERQKLLVREEPLRLHVILDEAVLGRTVGTESLMRDQLWRLAEGAQYGPAVIRILPAGAGAHGAMTGPFTILRYPDPADHDVVYCETLAGALYAEKPEDSQRARNVFAHLETLALPPGESMDMVATYAADL